LPSGGWVGGAVVGDGEPEVTVGDPKSDLDQVVGLACAVGDGVGNQFRGEEPQGFFEVRVPGCGWTEEAVIDFVGDGVAGTADGGWMGGVAALAGDAGGWARTSSRRRSARTGGSRP
jgi:hypothetical protein